MNGLTGAVASGAAAVIAGWFAIALGRRYVERGRANRALVYWGASLVMFALASAAMLVGELAGWSGPVYRVFYLFGGALVVPWLAMGTVQISSRDTFTLRVLGGVSLAVGVMFGLQVLRAEQAEVWIIGAVLGLLWGLLLLSTRGEQATAGSLAVLGVYSGLAILAVLTAPLIASVPPDELPSAADLYSPFIVGFYRGGSGLGAVMVIVGVAVMYAGSTRTTRLAVPPAETPVEGTPLVEVYTREDCGLCERAERLAAEEAGTAELRFVDIDEDAELQRRYNIRVPVVAVGGVEVAEGRIEPGEIAAAVGRSRSGS